MGSADTTQIPRTSEYSERLAQEFQQFRQDGKFIDFIIQCGSKPFPCHKHILAVNSPILKEMLDSNNNMTEASTQDMGLEDVSAAVMEVLLSYMYTGEVSISPEQCPEVLKASHVLQMPSLKERCVHEALSALKPSNVVTWHKLARFLDDEDFKSNTSYFLSSYLAEISKRPEFLELSIDEVSDFLSDAQEAYAYPGELLEATLGWVDHKVGERLECMEKLMQRIDLLECSIPCIDREIIKHEGLLLKCPKELFLITQDLVEIAKQGGVHKKKRQTIVAVGQRDKKCWKLNTSMEFVELCEIPPVHVLEFKKFGACKTPDGFIITGGYTCFACSVFTLATNSWKSLKDMKYPIYGHGSICLRGKLFVFGGETIMLDRVACVQSLLLNGGEWKEENPMPYRVHCPEVAGDDNSIFVMDTDVKTTKLLHFDIKSSVWDRRASPPDEDYKGTRIVMVRDQLIVAGGRYKTCAQYNTSTDTWTTGVFPRREHNYGGLVSVDSKLFLIGGQFEDGVEEYDLDTERWTLKQHKVPTSDAIYTHAFALDTDPPPPNII